ncbi:MAG: aconitase family protein, partial [Rhodothalassiaceae bacterium]
MSDSRTNQSRNGAPATLYDKIWSRHVVAEVGDGSALIYIDRHLVHEVTSPQAFESLRLAGRPVRRPEATLALVDHNVPTTPRNRPIEDPLAARQIALLRENTAAFGIAFLDIDDPRQGIVHVVGP